MSTDSLAEREDIEATIAHAIDAIPAASAAELENLRADLLDALGVSQSASREIGAQIASASTRGRVNRDWMYRATTAQARWGQRSQDLQRLLGEARARLRALNREAHAPRSDGPVDLDHVRRLWRSLGRALGEID